MNNEGVLDLPLLTFGFFWLSLAVALLYVLRSERLAPYVVVRHPANVKYGISGDCSGKYVKSNDVGEIDPKWFNRKTLILGYDKSGERGPASAEFYFDLRPIIRRVGEDTAASVIFEAERIHGGLHSALGPQKKRAVVRANGVVLDDFWLIQKMPNGQDYGYRNVGPIAIESSLFADRQLVITAEIEDLMAWDIDRVVLSLESGEKRLSPAGAMVAGAIISVMIGLLPVIIEKLVS